MKYCVIGLGVFGRALSTHLVGLGAEVLAFDNRQEHIVAVKDIVTRTLIVDYKDAATSFEEFPISEMDAVIIALGDNFEHSMTITMRMKELGAKKIVARVLSPMHERLLKLLKVDRIIVPEEFAARGLAHSLMINGVVGGYDVGDRHVIIDTKAPIGLVGNTLQEVAHVFKKFGILLVTVERQASNPIMSALLGVEKNQDPGTISRKTLGTPKIDLKFERRDILVLFGNEKKLANFLDELSKTPEKTESSDA